MSPLLDNTSYTGMSCHCAIILHFTVVIQATCTQRITHAGLHSITHSCY